MTTSTTETTPVSPTELADAVLDVLSRKGPALTVSQVRDNLPRRCRLAVAEIGRCLEGLVTEGKVHSWPPYRSKSPRYGAQAMEAYARTTMQRLLGEDAFTPHELIGEVREEVPGLPEDRCKQILEEVKATGEVRTLPPRLGSTAHLLGTPTPLSYLLPVFDVVLKNLKNLYVRLESEGVPRVRVLEEAKKLWQTVVSEAEKDLGPMPAAEPETEPESPPAFRPETAIARESPAPEGTAPEEAPASAPASHPESAAGEPPGSPEASGPVA